MVKKSFKAKRESLPEAMAFLEEQLDKLNVDTKKKMQISIAVEELFVNIANYSYAAEDGEVEIQIDKDAVLIISLIDSGQPFNPLERKDPDVNAPLEERDIGGLGIYMAKQNADKIEYEYKDGKNIVRIYKKLKDE